MNHDNEQQDYLAPEDDWDLPQPERPPVRQGAITDARPIERARPIEAPARPQPPANLQSHLAEMLLAAHPRAGAVHAPVALAHAHRPDLFPALAARSALFRMGRSAPGSEQHSGPVPSQGGYDLEVFGAWPRMRDKSVWEAAIQLAKERGDVAAPFPVVLSDIASRMGISDTGSKSLRSIWASLERLASCRVEFTPPKGARCGGSLLKAAIKQGRKRLIQFDEALVAGLFQRDYQFKIDTARRASLDGSLAQWLHDFLSTHAPRNKPLTVGYVRRLSGYAGDPRHFPALLRGALDDLATKAPGLLASHGAQKSKRSSEGWRIELARGPEAPSFEMPQPFGGAKSDVAGHGAVKRRRRSGPAL